MKNKIEATSTLSTKIFKILSEFKHLKKYSKLLKSPTKIMTKKIEENYVDKNYVDKNQLKHQKDHEVLA